MMLYRQVVALPTHIPHDGWISRAQSSIPARLRTEMIRGAPRHLLAHDTSLDLTGDDRFPIDENGE